MKLRGILLAVTIDVAKTARSRDAEFKEGHYE